MRETKFRAWSEKRRHMTYSDDYQDRKLFRFFRDLSDNDILIQYTGLKDKNGKEIYGGDIIKVELEEEVEFIDSVIWGEFKDCCVEGESWVTGENRWQRVINYWIEDCEVIGNIYENPELLNN